MPQIGNVPVIELHDDDSSCIDWHRERTSLRGRDRAMRCTWRTSDTLACHLRQFADGNI
jgi:hypothetical protein